LIGRLQLAALFRLQLPAQARLRRVHAEGIDDLFATQAGHHDLGEAGGRAARQQQGRRQDRRQTQFHTPSPLSEKARLGQDFHRDAPIAGAAIRQN
jgi:hypothetical protein